MRQAERDRVRRLMMTEHTPFWFWVAQRLPWGLLRAVVVLACRHTGKARRSRRGIPQPVSAEEILGAVVRSHELACESPWFVRAWRWLKWSFRDVGRWSRKP